MFSTTVRPTHPNQPWMIDRDSKLIFCDRVFEFLAVVGLFDIFIGDFFSQILQSVPSTDTQNLGVWIIHMWIPYNFIGLQSLDLLDPMPERLSLGIRLTKT